MRIRFTPSHDGETWPPILGERRAAFGEASLGPLGFVAFLETCTGLSGPRPSRAARIAQWLPELRKQEAAFYARSLLQDPVGTARVLLRWRDQLSLLGWTGEVRTGRLSDLARVDHLVANGLGDRLRAIRDRLGSMDTGIERIELSQPEEELALEWRKLLAALRAKGAQTSELPHPMGRRASYRLIRPYGPRIGADQVAAWLAAQDTYSKTVIINTDCVLDAALRRHGLPTTGAAEPGPGHGFQLVALTVGTAFWPADPKQVQELLTLRPGPLPPGLCQRLLRALAETPGIGNAAWEAAMREGIGELEADQDPKAIRARAEALFPNPSASSSPVTKLSAKNLLARLDILDAWLRSDPDLDATAQSSTQHSIAELRAVLIHNRDVTWDRLRLSRWLAELGSAVRPKAAYAAEAGLAAVRTPAAILAPAERILWWNFVRSPFDRDADIPWTGPERAALSAADISWPNAATRAERRSSQWIRPVDHAEELILVTPQFDQDGEECHPHPLWDELPDPSDRGLEVVQHARSLLPLPKACDHFILPDRVLPPREVESPSSLETLISCPLRYFLRYHANVPAGNLQVLPSANQLFGSLAHALFAELLGDHADKAGLPATFHHLAPRLAASLYQPGGQLDLRRQQQDLQLAFDDFTRVLADNDAVVAHCEEHRVVSDAAIPGGKIGGRLDLELGPEAAVIDFKTGKPKYLIEAIEQGRALQLAVYSRLLRGSDPSPEAHWPMVGYYQLRERRILSREPILGADPLAGATPCETYQAAALAAREAWRSITGTHRVAAPGLDQDGNKHALKGNNQGIDAAGKLCIEPGCHFCDFAGLCGRGLETAQ